MAILRRTNPGGNPTRHQNWCRWYDVPLLPAPNSAGMSRSKLLGALIKCAKPGTVCFTADSHYDMIYQSKGFVAP
jgi:hypothetical protein